MPFDRKTSRWLVAAAVFALCIAPTFISYRPYVYRWDDSGYLQNSIVVSRAFWSHDVHGVAHLRQIAASLSSFRPPAMRFMGLPWGPLTSWDAAGKCFLSLAVVIAAWAAFCLFLLVRMGTRPILLGVASLCALASFGPIPPDSLTNHLASAFMADSLFAWITLAALLLISWEARTDKTSLRRSFLGGVLWGVVLSAGAMTKISFLYFVVLILPALVAIVLRRRGVRNALAAMGGFLLSAAPAAMYLLKYGRASWENGELSSFGSTAGFYSLSLARFLRDTLRASPGLVLFLSCSAAGLAYLVIRGRRLLRNAEVLALLFVLGFGAIALASVNRQVRYLFPAILAPPFLLAVLLSGKSGWLPRKFAAPVAAGVFCIFVAAALPVLHRAERQDTLARADAVLARAVQCHEDSILLATDSPSLNEPLLDLSAALTDGAQPIQIRSVVYSVMARVPLEQDYRAIQDSSQVVFQSDEALSPPFTNQRVPEYRRYIRERNDYIPVKLWSDVIAYSRNCGSQLAGQ